MQNRIKLVVIDDFTVYHSWPIGNPEKGPRLEIVGYAVDASGARDEIPVLKPDALILNIEMSDVLGPNFLKEYPPSHPIPVILMSSLNVKVFDTLAAGAVDFVRKPDTDNHVFKETLLSIFMAKSTAVVASRVRISLAASVFPPSVKIPALKTSLSTKLMTCRDMVIAIGVSTGGTETILEVLRQLPENMPGVVTTQRMPASFTAIYAERLNRLCKMEAREVKGGDGLRPGLALLTPGGLQMKVVRMGNEYVVNHVHEERVNGHCPPVDVLFDVVSSVAGNRAMGIFLTSMGADGATGLLRVWKNGTYTIGQDRDTCVAYGMPMEVYRIGAVCQQSPLSSIPQLVINKLTQF